MQRRLYEILFFVSVEAVIFALYYLFLYFVPISLYVSNKLYITYEYGTPLLLGLFIWHDRDLRKAALLTLKSKDVFFLIAAIFIWGYVFALNGISPANIFYAPAIIDEINFRLVVTNFFKKFTKAGTATIIQAFMFMMLYANYIVFEQGGFPGIYTPLFLVDMFMMGILYGAIYFVRKNVYLDIVLHNTLYVLSYIVPASLAVIPYVMLPS